ncbi:MAG: hypothetical protein ACKO4A_02000, partial [Gammaproteobacteria bacterium]
LALAALPSGGWVATWQSGTDTGYEIVSRQFDSAGNALQTDRQVNASTSGAQLDPAVSALANGGYVITWESQGTDGSGFGVYGQRFAASGSKDSGEFRVNTTTAGGQTAPSVAGLSNGGFVIAWESPAQDTADSYGIFGQRYSAAGVPRGDTAMLAGGEFNVFVPPDFYGYSLTVTVELSDGVLAENLRPEDYLFVATSGDPVGGPGTVPGLIVTLIAGGSIGDDFATWEINSDGSQTEVYPQSFSIVWRLGTGTGETAVSYTGSPDAGVTAEAITSVYEPPASMVGGDGPVLVGRTIVALDGETEFRANASTVLDQLGADLVGLPGGGFVAVWSSAGQDGDGFGVFARRYGNNGLPLGDEFAVNQSTAGSQGTTGADAGSKQTAVAALASGGFVVAWTSLGQDGSESGVYARV